MYIHSSTDLASMAQYPQFVPHICTYVCTKDFELAAFDWCLERKFDSYCIMKSLLSY